MGAELVFYSTDAIFDGEHGPYSENATPNPICVYGHTKVGAEQAIRETIANHLIIRTTAVFGWDRASKNFAMGLWERLTGGEPMLVPNDQWCNPTLASYLAEASMKLVEKGQVGTFNVAGKDLITRSELAYRLARILNLDSSLLTSVPFHQLGRKTRLPLRGGFELDKFKAALETEPLPLDQALERFELHRQTDNLDVK